MKKWNFRGASDDTVRNATRFLNPIPCKDLSLFLLHRFPSPVSKAVGTVSSSARLVGGIFFLITRVLFGGRLSSVSRTEVPDQHLSACLILVLFFH